MVATTQFMLAAISNGVSIIAGVITSQLGWSYNYHVLMPFAAVQLILTVFFVPETAFLRPKTLELDTDAPSGVLDDKTEGCPLPVA